MSRHFFSSWFLKAFLERWKDSLINKTYKIGYGKPRSRATSSPLLHDISWFVFFVELACFTFFYIHTKKVLDSRKFSTSGFWSIFRCPEHNLTIFRKCLCVGLYVCLQNFVGTVSQEMMNRNWWNFIFSCTLI